MKKLHVFNRFERFWHWAQALLMTVMLATGFEIHGSWHLLGFKTALQYHEITAWLLITLWFFAIFWHFTTGEWKQYIPTTKNLVPTLRYYTSGIFKGESHPHHPTRAHKHNPLQILGYLSLKLLLHPWIWITGLLLLFYPDWKALGIDLDREVVVTLHVICAFLILCFLIIHVYLVTTGKTLGQYMKPMIYGYERVQEEDEK